MNLQHVYNAGSSETAIVLFHGYGADMNDLAGLTNYLDPSGKFHWYFPNGPVRVPFGNMWEGRAWFPIDMAELERAMRENRHRAFADKRPVEFVQSLELMQQELITLRQRHPRLILGGFSQGAMLASHLAALTPVDALIILSGTLLDRAGLTAALSQSAPTPFFQSHGDADALLSLAQAKDLNQLLKEHGWDGVWAPFRGGHEIPLQVIQTLQSFLARFA
jgi:phospholipase/carboxylesterase